MGKAGRDARLPGRKVLRKNSRFLAFPQKRITVTGIARKMVFCLQEQEGDAERTHFTDEKRPSLSP